MTITSTETESKVFQGRDETDFLTYQRGLDSSQASQRLGEVSETSLHFKDIPIVILVVSLGFL